MTSPVPEDDYMSTDYDDGRWEYYDKEPSPYDGDYSEE